MSNSEKRILDTIAKRKNYRNWKEYLQAMKDGKEEHPDSKYSDRMVALYKLAEFENDPETAKIAGRIKIEEVRATMDQWKKDNAEEIEKILGKGGYGPKNSLSSIINNRMKDIDEIE